MKRLIRAVPFVLLLMTIGCDRVTKHLATVKLQDKSPQSYLGDTIRLEYTENPGAFLSLGARLPLALRTFVLTVAPALALVAVAAAAIKLRWTGRPFIGAMLFLAGGFSNLIDRLTRGTVIDFMNVGVGALRTGIFNVADVALLAGLALIAIGGSRSVTESPEAQ